MPAEGRFETDSHIPTDLYPLEFVILRDVARAGIWLALKWNPYVDKKIRA